MIAFKRLLVLSLIALSLAGGSVALADGQDPTTGCLKYIPGEANIIVVLRVEKLLHSERGTKEGWAKKAETAFLGGTEPLPPWVDVAIRAAQYRPEEGKLGWSLGLIKVSDGFDYERIAERENSKPEILADHTVVPTRGGGYATLVNDQMLAVFSPAYRQDMARWIRRYLQDNHGSEVSAYLTKAVTNESSHLLVAVDTDHLFNPQSMGAWMKAAPALARQPQDLAGITRLFQGLRGVRFKATVDETTNATITFDFAEDVGSRGELVKGLFLNFLDDSSAVLEDFQKAGVAVNGRAVMLSTKLSDSGLKRILSMVTSPQPGDTRPVKKVVGTKPTPPATSTSGSTPVPPPPAAPSEMEISRRYYRAVNQLVDDISTREHRATRPEKTAVWHDNYARKIEQMSIAGVQPDLVNYAMSVATRLRALSASLRGVPMKVDTLQGSLTYNMQVNPGYPNIGWWGGGMFSPPTLQVTSNLQQIREQQAAAIDQGNDQRQQIWASLDSDRQAIRQKMYSIFNVDFGPTK